MNQELAEAIICHEDHPELNNYEEVKGKTLEDNSRWSLWYSSVYKNKTDNTFWEIYWQRDATEYQNQGVEDITFLQVIPKEVTTIIYEVIK